MQSVRSQLNGLLAAIPAYPPDAFSGRGIVTVGGGMRYIVPAWMMVHQLRHLGRSRVCVSGFGRAGGRAGGWVSGWVGAWGVARRAPALGQPPRAAAVNGRGRLSAGKASSANDRPSSHPPPQTTNPSPNSKPQGAACPSKCGTNIPSPTDNPPLQTTNPLPKRTNPRMPPAHRNVVPRDGVAGGRGRGGVCAAGGHLAQDGLPVGPGPLPCGAALRFPCGAACRAVGACRTRNAHPVTRQRPQRHL